MAVSIAQVVLVPVLLLVLLLVLCITLCYLLLNCYELLYYVLRSYTMSGSARAPKALNGAEEIVERVDGPADVPEAHGVDRLRRLLL